MAEKNPELEAVLEPVRDIFLHMEKVLRGYRLYEEGHVTVRGFEEKLFEKLHSHLEIHDELTIGIKPYVLEFAGGVAYENHDKQENFFFRFHQDGIRQLTFLLGITLEELRRFIEIARTDFRSYEYFDDDIVTLLWKAELDHVPYVVVETFVSRGEEVEDLEEVIRKMAKTCMVDPSLPSLKSLFSGGVPAVRRKLRRADAEEILNLPDIDLEIPDLLHSTEVSKLQNEIASEETLIIRKMILVLFRVLLSTEKSNEFQPLAGVVTRLVESLLRTQQFDLAAKIFGKLQELSRPEKNPSAANSALLRNFHEELSNPDLLDLIARSLVGVTDPDTKGLAQVFQCMHPRCARSIFHFLVTKASPQLREDSTQAMAITGAQHIDALASVVAHGEPDTTMWALEVLLAIGVDKTHTHIKRAYHHRDIRVRSKALDCLLSTPDTQPFSLCVSALKDAQQMIRMKALNWLVHSKDQRAAKPLFDWVRSEEFDRLDREEKKHIYVGLAKIGGKQLRPIFSDEFNRSVLERSEKILDRQICAIWALRTIGGRKARAIVEQERDRKLCPKEIRETCEKALADWPASQ